MKGQIAMRTYAQTRAEERSRQSVQTELRRFLRKAGCTTKGKRREAIERAALGRAK